MSDEQISRRRFVRDSLVGAAGIAAGLNAVKQAAAENKSGVDTKKILNYNPDMEYRRLGKTDLSGSPAPVPGATQTHVISGAVLAGGANNVWDESRRIKVKALNPHLYTKNELDLVAGHLWNNQPLAVDVPESYPSPSSDVIGNDDTNTSDPEDNDPYTSPNTGLLTGSDTPSSPMRHSTGSDGDTFEVRYHFGEFARLKLGSTWYQISGFRDWKTHFKYKRVAGQWVDDGSFAAANNTGF